MGQAKNRKAEIEQLKAQGKKQPEPKQPKVPEVINYGFFYSPTDTVKDVIAISCGKNLSATFPLEVGKNAWDNVPEYDKFYEEGGQEFVDYMFEQVNEARLMVIKTPGKIASDADIEKLVIAAMNICWLTVRGFIKQSEYNGTTVAALSSMFPTSTGTPPGFVETPAPTPRAKPEHYTPNEVEGHYRTQNGKRVFVKAYKRG
jgi:hypothetical protein